MNVRCLLFSAAVLALASPAAAEPDYAAAVRQDYRSSLGALFDHFHRNPELSFKETATAARMAKELRAIPGMQVTEKVGLEFRWEIFNLLNTVNFAAPENVIGDSGTDFNKVTNTVGGPRVMQFGLKLKF